MYRQSAQALRCGEVRGPEDDKRDAEWHLDKKVPIALIGTVVLQSVFFVWAASNLWTRVGELEHKVELSAPQFERIIRVETKMDGITVSLSEIKALIGKATEMRR